MKNEQEQLMSALKISRSQQVVLISHYRFGYFLLIQPDSFANLSSYMYMHELEVQIASQYRKQVFAIL